MYIYIYTFQICVAISLHFSVNKHICIELREKNKVRVLFAEY